MDQKLADLVQKKQQPPGAGKQIDWDERRNRYVAAVEALYGQIEGMLAEAVEQGKVVPEKREKELTESYIGTYAVNDLLLLIGNEQVRFSPRGRNIAGAEGRVDVVGERGEAILILSRDANW
ncbi:MAG TPA: hypothetical protein VN699_03055, partial [Pirellulales bacterium]|nr:hypothetical protein [Pirellulales bacterium]